MQPFKKKTKPVTPEADTCEFKKKGKERRSITIYGRHVKPTAAVQVRMLHANTVKINTLHSPDTSRSR